MSLSIGEVKTSGFAQYLPVNFERTSLESYSKIYERNRHRVYSLAFWMTDHELAAEALMTQTFCRAFAASAKPTDRRHRSRAYQRTSRVYGDRQAEPEMHSE